MSNVDRKLKVIQPPQIAKIDKGIPMPIVHTKRDKFPWQEMEIGDSFEYPRTGNGGPNDLGGISVRNTVSWTNRKFKGQRKFASRVMPDGTFRVWRIE